MYFFRNPVRSVVFFFLLIMEIFTIISCSKKSPDAPITMVPERLTITAVNESIVIGGTTTFILTYFDGFGQEAPVPNGIIWSVSNPAVATVDQSGLVTGISEGQTEVMVSYESITAKTLINVVADEAQIASVTIEPGRSELLLNETTTLTAMAKNINGDIIPGVVITWETDSAEYASVNAASGFVTANGYGTSNITAVADGIRSNPAIVQIIRRGDFSGSNSKGSAKLKVENGILTLETSSDFSVSTSPPDLRIYLGNNRNNVNGAVEVASLNQRSGAQSWNVASPVTIQDYRYVIVWCKQFGGTYGVADLGN